MAENDEISLVSDHNRIEREQWFRTKNRVRGKTKASHYVFSIIFLLTATILVLPACVRRECCRSIAGNLD